ncbi:MAG: hypothetical protein V4684_16935 [Pseudomonadota bacterium]
MSFLNRIPNVVRRDAAPKYQALDQPKANKGSQRLSASERPSQGEVVDEFHGLLEVDHRIDDHRQAVTRDVAKLLTALQQDDRESLGEAQNGLFHATQGMFKLGLPVEQAYQALVDEALGKLSGDAIESIGAKLAERGWDSGKSPIYFRVLGDAVRSQLSARAMRIHDAHTPQAAHWKRDHRDIGVQLRWLARPMIGKPALDRACSTLSSLMHVEDPMLHDGVAHREQGFEQHVGLMLGDWSDEQLICLQHNLARVGPSDDFSVQERLTVIRQQLQSVMDQRSIDEPSPKKLILRLANSGIETPPTSSAGGAREAVGRYTTWGSRFSVGSVLNQTLRYLTLSEPARKLGNWVQRGHDSGAQYAAGAVIKGLASITGAASAVVASVVTVAETMVVNVVGTTLRLFGGGALALAGASAKLVGLASPSANRAGDRIVGTAKGLVKGISLVNNTAQQQPIPPHMMARARDMARLARITGSTTADVRAEQLPDGFSRAHRGVIPREILSLEGGGTGKAAKLRFDETTGHLRGDRWSDLMVGVYVEEDAQGNGVAYHLSFVGTQSGRAATFKSDAAQSFFGFEDSAFQEADAIVKAFVARYGADKIKLQGHSLGGGLAQWAGIRNSGGDHPVQVTCFNAAGLHINMRNRLGAELIARSDVEHFNTAKDFLSQKAEGARSPFLGTQIGERYLIPESKGHSLKHHIEGLERLTGQAEDLSVDASKLMP